MRTPFETRPLIRFLLLGSATVLFAVGCASDPGAKNDDEAVVGLLDVPETPTEEGADEASEEAEDTTTSSGNSDWTCHEANANTVSLISNAAALLEDVNRSLVGGSLNSDEVTRDLLLTLTALTRTQPQAADHKALRVACHLLGQNSAAREKWGNDNRNEACRIWIGAKEELEAELLLINETIGQLNSLVSGRFAAASSAIEEGAGWCATERVN